MEPISKRMKRIRLERGLSVRESAQLSGVPVSTYREWEEGRQIKGEPYEKIARALNIPLYELLTGKEANLREVLAKIEEIENACKALRESLQSSIS